jgi:hypothetical protein
MASLRALGPVLLVMALSTPFSARSQSADETSDCRWLYSSAGAASYQELARDPERTPLGELRFGEAFGPGRGVIARDGALDFDGNLQWRFSSGGVAPWQNRAYAINFPAARYQLSLPNLAR